MRRLFGSPAVWSVATEGVLPKGYMNVCPDQVLHAEPVKNTGKIFESSFDLRKISRRTKAPNITTFFPRVGPSVGFVHNTLLICLETTTSCMK